MNKKILGSLVAGVIIISSIHIVPVIAGESNDNHQAEENTLRSKNDLRPERDLTLKNEHLYHDVEQSFEGNDLEAFQEEMRNKLILEKAQELGLSTDGKSIEDLEMELRATFGEGSDTEKAERTSSKDTSELRLNIGDRKELLKIKAKEFGLGIENQNAETIQQEILEKSIYKKANELGISTKGKELQTIINQLKERYENQTDEK